MPQIIDASGSTSALLIYFLSGNLNNVPYSFLSYGADDINDYPPLKLPTELDITALYFQGFNADYYRVSSEIKDFEEALILEDLAAMVAGEVSVTYYPASKLSANFDVDIFDLIIDPSTYTAEEVQYFASHGITPATKNADGSYTIKSQLTLPFGSMPVPIVPTYVPT